MEVSNQMIIFLLVLSLACALAVVYPYLIYPAILALLPKHPVLRGAPVPEDGSAFSLLFCAYNEAATMPSKLENIRELKLRYPRLDVLAFDDGSADGTADLIEQDAPFIRLIRGGGRNGKANGMKRLAAMAHGQFLVFTDANVLLDPKSLDALAACYADASVGGVCGALHYLGAEGSSTAAVGGLYWRLEEKIKDLESQTGSVMGADGSIFSIRSEFYPDFPDTVLDDFTVSMEIVFRGRRLVKSNDVIAYERLVSARSDEFARKARIAARAFHTHKNLASKRSLLSPANHFKYFSHKTLRWFGGFFLIVGTTSALAAFAATAPFWGLSALVSCIALVGIGLATNKGPIANLTEIATAMLATLVGVYRAMRGETFATWNPAKSR